MIDGSLKFAPGFVDAFSGKVSGAGQPAWLQGWFAFWSTQVNGNPAFWVYLTGSLELALGLALVFGFMRKAAYAGGALLSLFIWAVPEGFGGPYGPGSTDIGTGAMYALLFLALILINATYGPSRWSLDYLIERRFPAWARIAEFVPRT
ncbi:MAG: DoxX family protein [Thermoplasmata archaeon]|nr:DoxX family protein [Thermoplasmata archaeon]